MSRLCNLHSNLYVVKPSEVHLEFHHMKSLGSPSRRTCRGMSISKLIRSVFLSLKPPRQLKRFTPYHVRKNLAEALVLSKLDYANALFYNIPKYPETRCRVYRLLLLVLFIVNTPKRLIF